MWNSPRVLNVLALVVAMTAMLALIVTAIVAAARSPRFSIKRVEVSTPLKKVDRAFVERVVRKEFVGNYFTLNLPKARQSLSRLPWVKSVAIRRVWPRGLEVRIVEHEAFARWNADALVSADAIVFDGETADDLPQLNGPRGTATEVVDKFKRTQQAMRGLGLDVRVMTLSPSYSLSAELSQGASIHFGREQFDTRLARLVAFGPQIRTKIGVPIDSFDLRYSRGIAVAMSNEGRAPESAARAPGEPSRKQQP